MVLFYKGRLGSIGIIEMSELHKSFGPIGTPSAEKVQCVGHIRPVPRLCLNDRCQPVHSGAKIRIAADDIDGFKTGCVIQHSVPPPGPLQEAAGKFFP